MGIGVDIAFIPRFEGKVALARKILSNTELLQYQQHPLPAQFLAGRFAAKEAFIKAYNTLPYPDLHMIEVTLKDHGQPFIFYQGKIYALSIAHDGEYAIAFVVI
jgi:holo-[acyl-carrier protein] synthase